MTDTEERLHINRCEILWHKIAKHDLTFQYSDDHGVWQRGCQYLNDMMTTIDELTSTDDDILNTATMHKVVEHWNAMVDSYLAESYRKQFYWTYESLAAQLKARRSKVK